MRIYETTFIVNPQMEEATIDRQIKAVAETITQNGGNILQESHLGTRRLAYEIKGLTQGFYGGFIFESANETLPPLDLLYKLNEAYLRHLTVRFEGDESSLRPEKARKRPLRPHRNRLPQPRRSRPLQPRRSRPPRAWSLKVRLRKLRLKQPNRSRRLRSPHRKPRPSRARNRRLQRPRSRSLPKAPLRIPRKCCRDVVC